MYLKKTIENFDLLQFTNKISSHNNFVLLYSGIGNSNNKSFLALFPEKTIYPSPQNLHDIFQLENRTDSPLDYYFGYFNYEFFEQQTEELYRATFIKYSLVIEYNHDTKVAEIHSNQKEYLDIVDNIFSEENIIYDNAIDIISLESNFNKKQYIEAIEYIKEQIVEGNVYQANLTRKFFGKISLSNPYSLFLNLMGNSPGNYSAFIKQDDKCIISSSPELFLKLSPDGKCQSEPIKGTARRNLDPEADKIIKENLINSEKERAENLMITDLMRNDLNRSSVPGSVKVEELFKCTSYKTLHHLSSIITSEKRDDISPLEMFTNAFPPGSMTGAPKIATISLLKELEKTHRGIYSGSIGWYNPDSSFEFSVVIRTLIIAQDYFEFQVGGGITFDSDPIAEYEETITKAIGIAKSLGINIKSMDL